MVINELIRSNIDLPVIANMCIPNTLSFDAATARGKQLQVICRRLKMWCSAGKGAATSGEQAMMKGR